MSFELQKLLVLILSISILLIQIIVTLKMINYYNKNRIQVNLIIIIAFFAFSGILILNIIILTNLINQEHIIIDVFYLISFGGLLGGLLFNMLLFFKMKNYDKYSYFASNADKFIYLVTLFSFSSIFILNILSYSKFEILPGFFSFRLSEELRIILFIFLIVIASYIIINWRYIKFNYFKKPLSGLINLTGISLFLMSIGTYILYYTSFFIIYVIGIIFNLIGCSIIGYIIIKNPIFFDLLTTYTDLTNLIIYFRNGEIILDKTFIPDENLNPFKTRLDVTFFRGLISALRTITKERTKLNKIEFEGLNFLIYEGDFTTGLLVAYNLNKFLISSLKRIIEEFERKNREFLKNWNQEQIKLMNIEQLIKRILFR